MAQADRNHSLFDALQPSGVLEVAGLERSMAAARTSDRHLETCLIELGVMEEDALAKFLSSWLGMALVSRDDNEIAKGTLNNRDLAFFRRSAVVPYKLSATAVSVAMADPRDDKLKAALEFHFNRDLTYGVATPQTIRALLDGLIEVETPTSLDTSQSDLDRLTASANDGPIVKLVNDIITTAADAQASDIHLESGEITGLIRVRIDGFLKLQRDLSSDEMTKVVSRLKVMADLNISERRRPQDGRIGMVTRGRKLDIRMSTLPSQYGESVVLRLLDQSRLTLSWDQLGYRPSRTEEITRLIEQPNGIFLISGPTGSGKTTTLYTALSHINRPDQKIITVEDPIEYALPGIVQVQVQPEIDRTFATALRAVLRQDPNVVMVGEIRDAETAENAVRAALMGRLVLSTIHTNDAVSAIDRLLDLGVPPFLLAATLRGVLAQRLVRKICATCCGAGCADCEESGRRGRTVISELLQTDDELSAMIASGSSGDQMRAVLEVQDWATLQSDAEALLDACVVDQDDIGGVLGRY